MRVVGVAGRFVSRVFAINYGCKNLVAGIPHACKKEPYYPPFGPHLLALIVFGDDRPSFRQINRIPNKNGIPFREPRLTPINKSSRDRLRKALKVGAVRRLAQSLLDLSLMRSPWILPPGMPNTN